VAINDESLTGFLPTNVNKAVVNRASIYHFTTILILVAEDSAENVRYYYDNKRPAVLPLRALTTTSYSTPYADSEENFSQEFPNNSTSFTASEDTSISSENSRHKVVVSEVFEEQSFNMTSRSRGMKPLIRGLKAENMVEA